MPAPPNLQDARLEVFPYLSFEALFAGFLRSASVRPEEPAMDFRLRPVVVPSLAFGDLLQTHLADELGICLGWEFFTPRDFIHTAVGPGPGSPWTPRRLQWTLLPFLETALPHLGLTELPPGDRLAVAGMLADRFDQYGHFRPDLLRSWEKKVSFFRNSPAFTPALGEAEEWQRELWCQLRQGVGAPHPSTMPARINTWKMPTRFARLQVLCSGSIDPLLVDVLHLLTEAGAEVAVHVLLPTMSFLGDLRRRQVSLPEEENPSFLEELEAATTHPLLASMGRGSIGAFLLLGRLDESYQHWDTDVLPDDPLLPAPLLRHLQAQVRACTAPEKVRISSDDMSLQLHECHGPRREVEALRDEIFRAFSTLPDLLPDDIHIAAPNPETYAPFIQAILGQGSPPLAVRFTEIAETREHAAFSGLLALLSLARSPCVEASQILEFYRLPAVLMALGIEESDTVERWLRESGLARGLDPSQMGSLPWARQRLLAGAWFSRDEPAVYPNNAATNAATNAAGSSAEVLDPLDSLEAPDAPDALEFVLPLADDLRDPGGLRDRFLEHLCGLEGFLTTWHRAPLADGPTWAARLEEAAGELLHLPEEEWLALHPAFDLLRHAPLAEENGDSLEASKVTIDAASLQEWLSTESASAARRTRQDGRLSFGSLRHLQNLPCRVLCILGLDDFPSQNRAPAWDLLRQAPALWDRDPRSEDRQLFLDALLTPTDRILLFASTRNPRTGETRPISTCVEELLRVLATMGAAPVHVVHRLQPFSSDYFSSEAALPPSFDAEAAATAATLQVTSPGGGPLYPLLPEQAPSLVPATMDLIPADWECSSDSLIGFWKSPLKAFLQAQGITLPRDAEADADLNRRPLVLDSLQKWQVRHAVLEGTLQSSAAPMPFLRARLAGDRLLPPACLENITWNQQTPDVLALVADLQTRNLQPWPIEHTLPLTDAPDSAVVILRTTLLRDDAGAFLFYRAGAFHAARHFLDAWIPALLAAAHGESAEILLLGPGEIQTLPMPVAADAIGHLRQLVRGYWLGQEMPVCFEPGVSEAMSRKENEAEALGAGDSLWKQSDRFGGSPGPGTEPRQQRLWRDLEPFASTGWGVHWLHWSHHVATPLRQWKESSYEHGI